MYHHDRGLYSAIFDVFLGTFLERTCFKQLTKRCYLVSDRKERMVV